MERDMITSLKNDTMQVKDALKDLKKAFRSMSDEATRISIKMGKINYDNVKRNFEQVGKSTKQMEKDINSLTGTLVKSNKKAKEEVNKKGGTAVTSDIGGKKGLASSFGALQESGLYDMLSSSIGGAVNSGLSSAFGSQTGGAISSVLTGAMSGAAMGTSIAPGIGTAIGAALGTLAGAITAATKTFEAKDDAFKDVVKGYYDQVKESEQKSLTNGSSIAGSREKEEIGFSILLGGKKESETFLAELKGFTFKSNFSFEQLMGISKDMLKAGYAQKDIIPFVEQLGKVGETLGGTGDNKNAEGATLESLKSFSDKGIPVNDYLTDFMSKEEETFEGLTSRVNELKNEMDAAMGEGHNEERKEGLEAQIQSMSGENGERMKEANRKIGEWKASLENSRDEAIISSMNLAMRTTDYLEAEKNNDSLKMGEILNTAKIQGENKYKDTDEYKAQQESNLALIGKIAEDTALKAEYYNTGYIMGAKFSEGLLAAQSTKEFTGKTAPHGSGLTSSAQGRNQSSYTETSSKGQAYPQAYAQAYGLSYVPYDNYPALLHQGEKVLTASQARAEKQIVPVQVNVHGLSVREETDIDKVANALFNKLQKVAINVA